MAFAQRVDAVEVQAGGTAPDDDVAMLERIRRGLSARAAPPQRNVAGTPSDTETIGAPKSCSSRSWWSVRRAPGS